MSIEGKPQRKARFTLDPKVQIAYLLHEWRIMFRPSTLFADMMAGVAVALVALPLSLAIANASGVRPEVGLLTAVIGGIVVALFGGCRLQVSGPAAAMTFLVYEVISRHGLGGLIVATLLAGLFQILTGAFRVGRLMQFIPRPVVAGFLTGIGITILCQQSSVILGYDVTPVQAGSEEQVAAGALPDDPNGAAARGDSHAEHAEEGGAIGLLYETIRQIHKTHWRSLVIGLSAFSLMFLIPKISRRLPTPLIAVVTATAIPMIFGWSAQVQLLGELPTKIPMPRLPQVDWNQWNEIFLAAVTIYILASIESLLSASVVDSMQKETQVDHDQELVGQGLGNVASSLFGGIPVTGVIARSATNIHSGARTRFAGIFHALLILGMMLFLAPQVALIPLAALAGVLSAIAYRMIEFHMLRVLWKGSRPEAVVFLVTAGVMLVTDLIVGVQVGIVAAFLYVVYEMSQLNIQEIHLPQHHPEEASEGDTPKCPAVHMLRVDGPLFFASGFHLKNMMKGARGYRCLIIDLDSVPFLDVTGADNLEDGVEILKDEGIQVILARPSQLVKDRIKSLAEESFHVLRECPIHNTLKDAIEHASRLVSPDHLCAKCENLGHCIGLERVAQLPAIVEPKELNESIIGQHFDSESSKK